MKRFIAIMMLTAGFLGGYYLGHLPGSPDIFGWFADKYRTTKVLCTKASQGPNGRRLGVVASVGQLLKGIGQELGETSEDK